MKFNLTKSFPKNSFQFSASGTLYSGNFVVVQGPSKSGKTVLLRLLSGQLFPDSGNCSIGDSGYFYPYVSKDKRPKMRMNTYFDTLFSKEIQDTPFFNEALETLELTSIKRYYIPDLEPEPYRRMIALVTLFSDKVSCGAAFKVSCGAAFKDTLFFDTIPSSSEKELSLVRTLRDYAHSSRKTILFVSDSEEAKNRADQLITIENSSTGTKATVKMCHWKWWLLGY